MARNNSPVVIGAILFGVLAVGLTLFLLFRGGGSGPATPVVAAAPPEVKVFTATRPIAPRTALTSDLVTEKSVPADHKPAGAITDRHDLEGVLASAPIVPGDVITTDSVTTKVTRVIPANIPVRPGYRAVAIWIDPIRTAGGLVDVGDRVDVLVNHPIALPGPVTQVSSRVIAQDLPVLAVDRSLALASQPRVPTSVGQVGAVEAAQPGAAPAGAAPVPTPTPSVPFIRVILEATPTDAQRLISANTYYGRPGSKDDVTANGGYLVLTIRNPNSHDIIPVGAASPDVREHPGNLPPTAGAGAVGTALQNNAAAQQAARIAEEHWKAEMELKRQALAMQAGQGNNQPVLPPMAPGTPTILPQPTAPPKDVTVIRGTEKTLVQTPSR